jgi:hypothetical protein
MEYSESNLFICPSYNEASSASTSTTTSAARTNRGVGGGFAQAGGVYNPTICSVIIVTITTINQG